MSDLVNFLGAFVSRLKVLPTACCFVVCAALSGYATESAVSLLAATTLSFIVVAGLLLQLDPACLLRDRDDDDQDLAASRAMTRATLIPAIASLFLMSGYLGFQAYMGMKLFVHLSFEELGALIYLICSISWMLIKFCSLIGASNERTGKFFREGESVVLNVFLIAFFVSLKAIFNISP